MNQNIDWEILLRSQANTLESPEEEAALEVEYLKIISIITFVIMINPIISK